MLSMAADEREEIRVSRCSAASSSCSSSTATGGDRMVESELDAARALADFAQLAMLAESDWGNKGRRSRSRRKRVRVVENEEFSGWGKKIFEGRYKLKKASDLVHQLKVFHTMASQSSQRNASQPSSSAPSDPLQHNASQPSSLTPSDPLQHNASQPSSSAPSSIASQSSNTLVEKKLIELNIDGKILPGPHTSEWSSKAGFYIRGNIPVYYKSWPEVDSTFKDNVWNSMMGEFKLNVPEKLAREHLEKGFNDIWRGVKSRYRSDIIRTSASMEEAIEKCPPRVDPNHWLQFVQNEMKPEVQARNARNAENRKKRTINPCLGRQTYFQKLHVLDRKNPHKKHTRVDGWLAGCEHHDGSVSESAREKYDLVKTLHEQKSTSMIDKGTTNHENMDTDALTEVFGRDKKGRTRGVSSHISRRQLQRTAIGKALLQRSSNEEVLAQLAEMKAEMKDEMKSTLAKFGDSLMAMCQQRCSTTASAQLPPTSMPDTEIGSSLGHHPSRPTRQNLMNLFEHATHVRLSVNPKVILLDNKMVEVAEGFVVTNATAGIAHGRAACPGEKKVWVEKVNDGNARIYDGPQNGKYILEDIVEGGFVIWGEGRLKYL